MQIGLDLGSTAIKIVVLENGELKWCKKVPTAPGQEKIAADLIGEAGRALGLEEADLGRIAATGYGKNLVNFSALKIDEISANAKAVFHFNGRRPAMVINIGGQDLKIIKVGENGRVLDFKMNDKCAAGTGRFFELAARILDTPLDSFAVLSRAAEQTLELNSTCVVFAESEVVSLLARGEPRENIIKGLHGSVARRVIKLLGRPEHDTPIYLDGGPAQNPALVEALEDELLMAVEVLPNPQYTVACGAALYAAASFQT